MQGVAPITLHNAGVKYRAQLEVECLFIGPLTSRQLFFLIPGIPLGVANGSIACSCFPLFWGKCSFHMQNWDFFLCSSDNLL